MSGGIWGLEQGYSLMIGGDDAAVAHLDPVFRSLAPDVDATPRTEGRTSGPATAEHGYLHCGTSGAGHPEYYRHDLDVAAIAEVWRRGSVIRSWLLDLAAAALLADPDLEGFTGRVSDSGEGRWTVAAAVDEGVPAHVISAALLEGFSSRDHAEFADMVAAAMRSRFGGHDETGRS